jgi:PKD repeat protein
MNDGNCTPGSNFNALTVANLNVELIGANGATVLASGNVTGAGVVETIDAFNLVTPGTYFVRVFQAVSVNNVQGYNLTVAAADAGPPAPVANFTVDVTAGTAPLTVTFTDTSTESPTSWAWDFDNNGSTDSTDQNPSHAYSAPGVYTVKLTATNANGFDDEVKTGLVTVTLLETSIQVTGGGWAEVGDNVTFTAGPSGATGYQWFKDGNPLGGEIDETLDLVSVTLGDSGGYYCEVTTAAKGVANTQTLELTVFPLGSLPVSGSAGLALMLGALAGAATALVRRKRRKA